MKPLVRARIANAADLETVVGLADAEHHTVRSERGGRWHLDHDVVGADPSSDYQRALDVADANVVVGCIDDVVVGFASVSLSPTVDGQLCMIDELIVHPQARAVGVGSEILEVVRAWALEHDCQAIESQVLPGNRAAKNFFERVGMKTRKMRVSADL